MVNPQCGNLLPLMSQLGISGRSAMSAPFPLLPPERTCAMSLFYHLVGAQMDRGQHGDAECLGRS
jgi:hypothetical protein